MKVSVYCMVYNHEPYLRSAMEGFVSQKTDFDYEVFVHDDASTDGSRAIIEEYADKYPHIIKPIYQNENQFSKGVEIVDDHILPRMCGKYIAICEGDDYWCDEHKLQLQADFLDANPEYSACVHNSLKLDMLSGSQSVMYSHTCDEDILVEDVLEQGGAAFHTSSMMYRTEYASQRPAFYYVPKSFRDYPLSIQLALNGKIRFINRAMSVYRCCTVGSWTDMNRHSREVAVNNRLDAIAMLEAVNEYTDYAYRDSIEQAIIFQRYAILYIEEKYAEMRKAPYTELYKAETRSQRMRMFIKQHFGFIYTLYKKIRH